MHQISSIANFFGPYQMFQKFIMSNVLKCNFIFADKNWELFSSVIIFRVKCEKIKKSKTTIIMSVEWFNYTNISYIFKG